MYRIILDNNGNYRIQNRLFWLFWLELSGTYNTIEKAEMWAEVYKSYDKRNSLRKQWKVVKTL